MKQVLIVEGRAVVEDVPAPVVEPGSVLVRVDTSCISVGTELSGVATSAEPLWKRAIRRPQTIRRGFEMVATHGIARTRELVKGSLQAGQATGYSAAGEVIEIGAGVDDIRIGDRVACAGAQHAHHAEVVSVPRNLVARVPDGVTMQAASTTTLGAIALQGVRRAQPTLGESFGVIGLGVIGQLCVQILKANGCHVIGTDLDGERVDIALRCGMDVGITTGEENIEEVVRLTDGVGTDGVLIAASTPSDKIVSTAFGMCRKKGRVVLIGDVGLDLDRSDFYEKELDFLISTSYGPGRYDRRYEEEGLDYPVGYVRWTENRNMGAYLRLLDEGKVDTEPLIGSVHPVTEAPAAYQRLQEPDRPLTILLTYPEGRPADRVIPNPRATKHPEGPIRIAVIGAGAFAKSVHLPNLRDLPDRFALVAIASRTGHNAAAVAKQHGASYSTTDVDALFRDDGIDAVMIATRHDLHAPLALQALRAGKHVFVEKPLAVDRRELEELQDFYEGEDEAKPLLFTGFNRRFSPAVRSFRERLGGRSAPAVLNYRMNAGYLPPDHWVHSPEGGGRNIGEACHAYDVFTALTGSRLRAVSAQPIRPRDGYYSHRDNFIATTAFEDGSVASLTYTSLGAQSFEKERLEIFNDGTVLVIDDYRRWRVYGHSGSSESGKEQDKGHRAALEAFADALLGDGTWPIPLWEQFQAMEIAFRVEDELGQL